MSKLFKILAVLLALAAIVCTGVTAWNMHEKYTQEQAVVNDLKSQIAHLTKREGIGCHAECQCPTGGDSQPAAYRQ